jgi:hypothetical protein
MRFTSALQYGMRGLCSCGRRRLSTACTSYLALKTFLHQRSHRKYVLEYQDGEPVFRFAEIGTENPRSELDVFFDDLMTELFGPDPDANEIVPQKLAKLFPGSGH